MQIVKELPEIFETFGEAKKQSYLKIKELKEQNKIVVGSYCTFFPQEIVRAMGAVSISLCSYSNEVISAAEQVLPNSICPLVKSSYGFAITDKCPYFYFSDLVVGETTCDCKKKMYELMAEFKDIYVMQLPNFRSDNALKLWKEEIIRFRDHLEDRFHTPISEQAIREAIKTENRKRRALAEFYRLMTLDPPPITGRNLLKVLYGNKYVFDAEETIQTVSALTETILKEYKTGPHMNRRPRILITGCPIGGDVIKVLDCIEDNGGIVVGFENCTGAKSLERLVDEEEEDVFQALAEKYLNIGCAVMSPNYNRLQLLGSMVDEYQVDGVVELILTGCHPVHIESISIRNFLNEEKHVPYLQVVTDFSRNDIGQLNTRIGAFVEMLNS